MSKGMLRWAIPVVMVAASGIASVIGIRIANPAPEPLSRAVVTAARLTPIPVEVEYAPELVAAVIPATQPTPAARPPELLGPEPPKTYSISGSVWVMRKNGSSDLMRGLKVVVLRPTASKHSIVNVMEQSVRIHENEWRSNGKIESIRGVQSALPVEMDVGHAYRLITSVDPGGPAYFSSVVNECAIGSVTTGADGTYTISGLASGNYFLYATFTSETITLRWLVPARIGDANVALNLFNDNAAQILSRL